MHIFMCAIALVFTANVNAKNSPLISLEGDVIYIPAGSFFFGTNKKDTFGEALSIGLPKPWHVDEGPEQNIFLKSFYIDRHEVTNLRYKVYIDDLNAVPPKHWKNNEFPNGQGNFPVVNVTWYDSSNFCQWAEKNYPLKNNGKKLLVVKQEMSTLGGRNFTQITLTYQQNREAETPSLKWDPTQEAQPPLVSMI